MQTQNTETALRRINRKLDYEIERGLAENERLLRELLVICLNKTHSRLVRGQIDLGRYYADTQALACMAERLNNSGE